MAMWLMHFLKSNHQSLQTDSPPIVKGFQLHYRYLFPGTIDSRF